MTMNRWGRFSTPPGLAGKAVRPARSLRSKDPVDVAPTREVYAFSRCSLTARICSAPWPSEHQTIIWERPSSVWMRMALRRGRVLAAMPRAGSNVCSTVSKLAKSLLIS
jgi:hypothetical protein